MNYVKIMGYSAIYTVSEFFSWSNDLSPRVLYFHGKKKFTTLVCFKFCVNDMQRFQIDSFSSEVLQSFKAVPHE